MPRAKTAVPSSAILSILCSLVAAEDTSDSPPDFLCPTLVSRKDTFDPRVYEKAKQKPRRRRNPVVNKFAPDEQGHWRRVPDFSLYGIKICSSQDCDEASTGVQIGGPQPPTSTAVLAATITYPVGWDPPDKDSIRKDLPAIIMALSIALAVLVCVFTLSCHFWRKGRRRKHRADVESKEKKKGTSDKEREFKHKQHLWARATARWRSNVKLTARKRRADKSMRTSIITPSHTPPPSQPSTRPPSPVPEERPQSPLEQSSAATSSQRPDDTAPASTRPISSSPPAYHHPPESSSSSQQQSSSENYAGHVATDDKVLLAQRAELANVPEFGPPPTAAVSAPEWQDERLEDFDPEEEGSTAPHLPFPLPPEPVASSSKGKMAAFEQQYAYFPEYTDAEPELGPSAPPFEAVGPSAPPIEDDDVMLLASAPPPHDDEDEEAAPRSTIEEGSHALNPSPSLDDSQRLDNG